MRTAATSADNCVPRSRKTHLLVHLVGDSAPTLQATVQANDDEPPQVLSLFSFYALSVLWLSENLVNGKHAYEYSARAAASDVPMRNKKRGVLSQHGMSVVSAQFWCLTAVNIHLLVAVATIHIVYQFGYIVFRTKMYAINVSRAPPFGHNFF